MIDIIGTLRRLSASILGISTDTTNIAADVAGLDGDAMRGTNDALLAVSYEAERGTDNATLQATWTDAMATALANYTAVRAVYLDELAAANLPADIDTILTRWTADLATALANYTAVRAGYLDELAAANLPSDIDDILSNLAASAHRSDSRSRVYPQDTQDKAILICGNDTYDTFGDWVEVIPINTIDFAYRITGLVVEEVSNASTYFVQLGYSIIDESIPSTAQIVGERRFKLADIPIRTAYNELNIFGFTIPANAKLWGKAKCEAAELYTVSISVVVLRSIELTNPIVPLTTWPWAS